MNSENEYVRYLSKRSKRGLIYRNNFLYRKISNRLNGRCLDFGCGIGDMLAYRSNTIGVDINKENVGYCKSIGLECYQIEDGTAPFDDESFDSILLDNVLEHVVDPKSVIREAYRLCKFGGTFVIGVPGIKGFQADPDHKIFYDENILQQILETSGFSTKLFFYTPLFKSHFLSRKLRQYCIYAVAIKTGIY